MKHIIKIKDFKLSEKLNKQYEQVTHTDKYLVWDISMGNHIQLFILEVTEPLTIYNNQITSITLYSYNNKDGLTISKGKSKCYLEDYEIKKEVIFQSNNLQDCIDHIPYLIAQNKFNL